MAKKTVLIEDLGKLGRAAKVSKDKEVQDAGAVLLALAVLLETGGRPLKLLAADGSLHSTEHRPPAKFD